MPDTYIDGCDCSDCDSARNNGGTVEETVTLVCPNEGMYFNYCDALNRCTIEDCESCETASDEMVSCGEYHCSECYPDGPIDAGCDCGDCYYEDEYEEDRGCYASDVWPTSIYGYSHKPPPVFWHQGGLTATRLSGRHGNRNAYLGMELEIELTDMASNRKLGSAFQDHYELTDRIYCKEDSSLRNGVELVSHPMTIEAWNELYSSGEFDFYRKLSDGGCESRQTCGLHIHINRSSFRSLSHQARFSVLIVRNRSDMERIARRSASYATFEGYQNIPSTVRGNNYCPRGAVNLGNSATIEVRMFASTLVPSVIIGNLEMVKACQDYTRDRKSGLRESLTFDAFRRWLADNSTTYPHAFRLNETSI